MPTYCCVYGCKNNDIVTPNLMFFSLPEDKERKKKWVDLIDRCELLEKRSKSYKVCSVHFSNDMIIRRKLKPGAIPSLNLPGSNAPSSSSSKKDAEIQVGKPMIIKIKQIENDTENFMQHRLVGARLKFIPDVNPHEWDCQPLLKPTSKYRDIEDDKVKIEDTEDSAPEDASDADTEQDDDESQPREKKEQLSMEESPSGADLTPQPLRLIEEVEKRPGLWNVQVSREEKLALWREVGASMYSQWNKYSKATQYDIVLQLQSKWRSIRDGYNREIRFRKTGIRKYHRTYMYFKKLLFLGSYDGEVSDEEPQQEPPRKRRKRIKEMEPKPAEIDEAEPDYIEIGVPSTSKETPTRAKIKREVNIPSTDQHSDRLYLLSFLPDLVQLPRNIKMWAKTQIAQVMEQAVNHHLNGNFGSKADPKAEPDSSP